MWAVGYEYIEDCVENKIQFTRKIPHGVTTKEFLKPTTSMCNQEDKENTGGKECRLQEPCESPESANILSSTSVYINKENSRNQRPQYVHNQEDKENPGYENFHNSNIAASLLILFHCSGKEGRLQEPCTTTGFGHDGTAECLISWRAGKYFPYDICIRLFG
ncbi:hypothetical protein GEV33_005680 [Tenebrio molitor]|uniref:Uncharacterized protein n=1 Tax=Tenebrio molitor TaxID=7067 RepID=A0A8J6HL70_TENMO|nr:hypothetical protein GEV33_005680 [Tenebrio molitor]